MLWGHQAITLLSIVTGMDGKLPEWWRLAHPQFDANAIENACRVVIDLGLLRQVGRSRESTFWEMDHKTPLWDGGSNEIKNLRTLCIPCHRDATREGSAQRASQRRQA